MKWRRLGGNLAGICRHWHHSALKTITASLKAQTGAAGGLPGPQGV